MTDGFGCVDNSKKGEEMKVSRVHRLKDKFWFWFGAMVSLVLASLYCHTQPEEDDVFVWSLTAAEAGFWATWIAGLLCGARIVWMAVTYREVSEPLPDVVPDERSVQQREAA
jgi:hypothetical protein